MYPKQTQIGADEAILDVFGFHQFEHDESGNPYRSTGPQRYFSFNLFVDRRTPAGFILSFRDLYAQVSVERLRAFVDGKEVLVSLHKMLNGWEARGVIPPRREPGATVLTFVVPQVLSPRSKGQEDTRLLGLSFRALTVETSPALAADVHGMPVGALEDPLPSKSTKAPAASTTKSTNAAAPSREAATSPENLPTAPVGVFENPLPSESPKAPAASTTKSTNAATPSGEAAASPRNVRGQRFRQPRNSRARRRRKMTGRSARC